MLNFTQNAGSDRGGVVVIKSSMRHPYCPEYSGPEYSGQVVELMSLIDWSCLDGPGVVGNFLVRRVMPYQRRSYSAYEYAGSQDPTRMCPDGLEKTEVQQLMNELFNLSDDNFVRSDDRMHTFKLGVLLRCRKP